MKLFKPNPKYTKIALYALATIACCIIFVLLCINSPKIFSAVGNFLGSIKSVFYSIIFAMLIYPLVRSYERMLRTFFFKKKNKPSTVTALAIAGAYITVLIVVFVLVFSIFPLLKDTFTTFTDVVTPKFNRISAKVKEYGEENQYIGMAIDRLSGIFTFGKLISLINPSFIIDFIMLILGEAYNIIIGLIISIYLLTSRKQLGRIFGKLFMAVLPKKNARKFALFLNHLYTNLMEYLSVRMISSLYIACLSYTLCWIFRIPFYPLITLVVFIGNLIPVFGPVIATAILVVIMLISYPNYALLLLCIILFSQFFDSLFIEKTMLSDRLRPNIGVTIVLVIIGFSIANIFGCLICIPVYATLSVEVRKFAQKLKKRREMTKKGKTDAGISEKTEEI